MPAPAPPGRHSLAQGSGITRVDFFSRTHRIDPRQVDAIQLHCTHAFLRQGSQLAQMLGATLGHGIQKCRDTGTVKPQGDTFDLDIGKALRVLKAKIDATFFLPVVGPRA